MLTLASPQYAVQKCNNYPESAALDRKPLPLVSAATKSHVDAAFESITAFERQLEKQGWVGKSLVAN